MKSGKRIAASLLALVVTASCLFTATPAQVSAKTTVKSVSVKSSITGDRKNVYVAKGKSVKLKTTVDVKPNKKANRKVSYKVKNSRVAKVSSSGKITGKKAGTTKITVTSKKNKKKKASITVKVMKNAVKSVELRQKTLSMTLDTVVQMNASVTPKKDAAKQLAWSSSNEKVATVSSSGVVKAVAAGNAVITAKAIDGSGKKASCAVTVVSPVSLTEMEILNSRTVRFSLNQAAELTAAQVSVMGKALEIGAYRHDIKIEKLFTSDKVNYVATLEEWLSAGDYLKLSVPSLDGVKTMEKQYLEPIAAYAADDVITWRVGEEDSYTIYFEDCAGYVKSSITGLPAGLKGEETSYGIEISGKPAKAGVYKAVFTAVDELGSTMTKNIYIAVGSDTVLAGAHAPYYCIASKDGEIYINPIVTGGSGFYMHKILADPNHSGATFDPTFEVDEEGYCEGAIRVPCVTPGVYILTVRVCDRIDSNLWCDVQMEVHVAKGITVSGCVRDAQGNPVSGAYVDFTNRNRTDRYSQSSKGRFYTDAKGVYSAVLMPGTYDIEANNRYDAEEASGAVYVVGQELKADRTGYDFRLPLYKVSLVSADAKIQENMKTAGWYIGENMVGVGSHLYLKAGSYALESDTVQNSESEERQGTWFHGQTVTKTINREKYTAAVRIVNAAVQQTVTKVPEPSYTRTVDYPAAVDAGEELWMDGELYSLFIRDVYDSAGDWADEVYTTLMVKVAGEGDYVLTSRYGQVNLYDEQGEVVEPSAEEEGNRKSYTGLAAGTYYIGTGDYDTYDTNINMAPVGE